MKSMKRLSLLVMVALSALLVLGLSACGKKDTTTVGGYLDDGYELNMSISGETAEGVFKWGGALVKDGDWIKVISNLTKDQAEALDALDVTADDYDAKYDALVRTFTVATVEDLNVLIPPQKDLDALVGQPLGALEDQGYEMDGWSITEDEAWVFVSSDKVSLRVQLSGVDPDAEPSEWSDEVRRQFPIMKVEFLDFPFSVLAV